MAKRRLYKKPKNGEPIEVTARQLHQLYIQHEGILTSREYGDVNEAILRMYFVRRWAVDKRWLLAEPIDITPSYNPNF